ncbi:hypothetical protein GCM10027579_07270 [Calidifontibacter terrae]
MVAARVVSPTEGRDVAYEILRLLDVPAKLLDTNGIDYQDVDEADGPLVKHVVALTLRRFPLE